MLFRVIPINSLGLVAANFDEETNAGCTKINAYFEAGFENANPRSSASVLPKKTVPSCTATSANATITSSSSTSSLDSSKRPTKIQNNISSSSSISKGIYAKVPSENTNPSDQTNEEDRPENQDCVTRFFNRLKAKSPKKKTPIVHIIPGTSPSDIPNTQKCERCGKYIFLWDYVSHMDFHIARDLSREINGLPPLGFDLRPETLDAQERERDRLERERRALQSPAKKRPGRGRGGGSSSKRGRTSKPPVVAKPIDSYFVKKN